MQQYFLVLENYGNVSWRHDFAVASNSMAEEYARRLCGILHTGAIVNLWTGDEKRNLGTFECQHSVKVA